MKKISLFFTFSLFTIFALSVTSCNTTCDCDQQNKLTDASALENGPQRGGANATEASLQYKKALAETMKDQLANVEMVGTFAFDEAMLEQLETLEQADVKDEARENAAFVASIMNTLVGTDDQTNMLDMEFSMSDQPITDGLFIFSLKPNEELDQTQALTFQIFKESTFEMVANNAISITPGSNYKAINVKDFEDGMYIFKLKDTAGKELVRRVQLNQNVTG